MLGFYFIFYNKSNLVSWNYRFSWIRAIFNKIAKLGILKQDNFKFVSTFLGGVLLLVENYTGDVLNFASAMEIARTKGYKVILYFSIYW